MLGEIEEVCREREFPGTNGIELLKAVMSFMKYSFGRRYGSVTNSY